MGTMGDHVIKSDLNGVTGGPSYMSILVVEKDKELYDKMRFEWGDQKTIIYVNMSARDGEVLSHSSHKRFTTREKGKVEFPQRW